MSEQGSIETLASSDLPSVIQIDQESFEDSWTEEQIRDRFERNPKSFKVIKKDGGGIGYYYAHEHDSRTPSGVKEKVAEIGSIAVVKAHRGKGVGELLLSSAVKQLLAESKLRIVLHTRIDNEPMIRLAQKVGFRMVGIIPDFYHERTRDAYEFEYSR